MDTQALIDEVVDRSGERRDDTRARQLALGWLNQAQGEILARGSATPEGGWWFQRDRAELALSTGVSQYDLAPDILEVMDASLGPDEVPMEHVDWLLFREVYGRDMGVMDEPRKWTVESRTHPGGLYRFRVWPAPDEGNPCHLTVKRQFADLVDVEGNAPLLPTEFHTALWLRACALRMLHHRGTADVTPGYQNDFERIMQSMVAAHERHMGRRVSG